MSEYRDNIIKLAALNEAASSTGLEEIMSTKFAPIAWVIRQVAISNAEIADAQWPGPPRANDRCVIDGRTTTIQACNTRRLRNEIVLHLIQVRG